MKLVAFLVGFCLSFCMPLFAGNQHFHPKMDKGDQSAAALTWSRYCEIEIINNSYENVTVEGIFDDGSSLYPVDMYVHDSPYYISLYYYGYCHSGMSLFVETWYGYRIFSGYVRPHHTLYLVPYLTNKVKAEIHAK